MIDGPSNSGKYCLPLSCHQLTDNFCNPLIAHWERAYASVIIKVDQLDLYHSGFIASLSETKCHRYHAGGFPICVFLRQVIPINVVDNLMLKCLSMRVRGLRSMKTCRHLGRANDEVFSIDFFINLFSKISPTMRPVTITKWSVRQFSTNCRILDCKHLPRKVEV